MWKFFNEYRIQSDEPDVIEKIKRRQKFRQVSWGDIVIFQRAFNSLRDAKKTLSALTDRKSKIDTLEGIYEA